MTLTKTRCPVCDKPLDKIVQEYPAKYNKPSLTLYTCINKVNCIEAGLGGTTGTKETWLAKYPAMSFED